MNDKCYITKCPIDILDLICEWVCRISGDTNNATTDNATTDNATTDNATTERTEVIPSFRHSLMANSAIGRFVQTCRRIRDVAYSRVMGTILNHRGIEHICSHQLGEYYSKIVNKLTQCHFAHVVNTEVRKRAGSKVTVCCVNKMRTADAAEEYVEKEREGIAGGVVIAYNEIAVILMNLNRGFIVSAWSYLCSQMCRLSDKDLLSGMYSIFAIRGSKYPDLILSGAHSRMYECALKAADTSFALEMLQENMSDLQKYVPAMKMLFESLTNIAPKYVQYPWRDRSPYITLMHSILSLHNYQKEWLKNLVSPLIPPYRTYLNIQYKLGLKLSGTIDETTLQYYLECTDTCMGACTDRPCDNEMYTDIILTLTSNPRLYECIIKKIPLQRFTILQIHGILRVLLPYPSYFYSIFNMPYVNPLMWCDDIQLEFTVREECILKNLNVDDAAIVLIYALDEAEKHRRITQSLFHARDDNEKLTRLDAWYLSRDSEGWNPVICVSKYAKDREDGEREQSEINREQARIRLNWSQDMYDVEEWRDDIYDCAEDRVEYEHSSEDDSG